MDYKESVHDAVDYFNVFLKWIFCACIVGIVCGIVGCAFHTCVELATITRLKYPWLLWCLPWGGLAIVLLYRMCGMENDPGTNLIISSIRTSEPVPRRMVPLIFIGTVITHLTGGSSGREGAALQIGGCIGTNIGNYFHLTPKECHVVTMCGMSSVFAAIFGTPLTASIFAMEVVSVGVLHYSAIIPCVLASIIGYSIAGAFGIAPVSYLFVTAPSLTIVSVLQVIVLAALCAVISILFCLVMHNGAKLYRKWITNPYLRIAVGACLVIAFTYLCGSRDYNGAGMDIISNALSGTARPEAFFLKMVFTALTLGAGFKGGEIVPTFFIGSTFGCVVGGLLGLPPGFGAAVGLISLFCGVVNCPITSLILSIELFGTTGMLLFAVACGVSYMLSGYYSLYSSQKIVYSKLKTEFINSDTK